MKRRRIITLTINVIFFLSSLFIYGLYVVVAMNFTKLVGLAYDIMCIDGTLTYVVKKLVYTTISMVVLYSLYSMIKQLCITRLNISLGTYIFDKIQNTTMENIVSKKVETNTLANFIFMLRKVYFIPIGMWFEGGIHMIISLYALLSINISCGLIYFSVNVIFLLIQFFICDHAENLKFTYQQKHEELNKNMTDYILNYDYYSKNYSTKEVIKEIQEENSKLNKMKMQTYHRTDFCYGKKSILSSVFMLTSIAYFIVLACLRSISQGECLACILIDVSMIYRIFLSLDHLSEFLKGKRYFNIRELVHRDLVSKYQPKLSITKKIQLKNLSYVRDGKKVLTNLNITFEKGKKYAIVGKKDSGKSYLLQLMLGYYKDYIGEVYYDDTNMKDMISDSVFRCVTYIPNYCYLFRGLLKENVTLFDEKQSYTDLLEVLKQVDLSYALMDKSQRFKKQIDTNHITLTEEERKKILLARGILKGGDVLFVDDVTGSLDVDNYIRIENLFMKQKDLTIVNVISNLEKFVLLMYDEIIVIDGGKVSERGSFSDLISRKGDFYELYLS